MRSREKHFHVSILLVVSIVIALVARGTVNAQEEPEVTDTDVGGGNGGDAGGGGTDNQDEETEAPAATDDVDELPTTSGDTWQPKDQVDDPAKDEEQLKKEEESEAIYQKLPGDLATHVCLVKWRHINGKIVLEEEQYGHYDSVGTIISRKAILASPTGILVPIIDEKTDDLGSITVKSVLVNVADGTHLRIPAEKLQLFFHPLFSLKRDTPHHFVVIYLKEELKTGWGLMPPLFVTNPMAKHQWFRMNPLENEDYAVTRCELVVYSTESGRSLLSLSMVLSKCTYRMTKHNKELFANRLCGRVRTVKGGEDLDVLADRQQYPNDVGSPLFCYGSFVGMYMGITNIEGNWFGNKGHKEPSKTNTIPTAQEQYAFEIPGSNENYRFIRSVTSVGEGMRYAASYAPFPDNDTCIEEVVIETTPYDPNKTPNTWVPGETPSTTTKPRRDKKQVRGDATTKKPEKGSANTKEAMFSLTILTVGITWLFS